MERARVLVLEDDTLWQETICDVLEPLVAHIAVAGSLDEARRLLDDRYFNVAVVDLSLKQGDAKDSQGLEFLNLLRGLNLEDTVRCIILSGYGSVRRVRDAFHNFQVVDFLDKGTFQSTELIEGVRHSLEANHLVRQIEIETMRGSRLDWLWQEFAWAQREDPFQLEPELYDLLLRLFPEPDRLFISTLPRGQSGAGILQIDSYYGASRGTPVIVKFGKKDKIRQEHLNYQSYVQPFVSAYTSTQFRCVTGKVMGAICYQLIGTELADVFSFKDYYEGHEAPEICKALDNLFYSTCSRWYDNREQLRDHHNLVDVYAEGLHIDWNEIWAGAAETGVDLSTPSLRLPGVAGEFENPRYFLEARNYTLREAVRLSVTHGDLNEHNVLVTEEGNCWLIDFYRSGPGHILRDVIELETGIKFGLAGTANLAEHEQLESTLLKQTRLDRAITPAPRGTLRKALLVIGHLRHLAGPLGGNSQAMMEYNCGLLLTTLNLLRLPFLRQERLKILLSAALLSTYLARRHKLP